MARLYLLVAFFAFTLPLYASERTCFAPDQASEHAEKDICLTAHVYDIVEGSDGTRYLDVCKPEVADDACHFAILSLAADRREVGDLARLRDQDIRLRGVVHVVHGQSTMVLSHARQFRDGPEKFRPNPALMAGFSAESSRTAFRDPVLSAHHHKGSSAFLGRAH